MNRVDAAAARRAIPLRLAAPAIAWHVDDACRLDRLADIELQLGHVARAEHLAFQAAELRGIA